MIGKVNIYLTPEHIAKRSTKDEDEEQRLHDLEIEAVLKVCDALPYGVIVDVRTPTGDLLYTPMHPQEAPCRKCGGEELPHECKNMVTITTGINEVVEKMLTMKPAFTKPPKVAFDPTYEHPQYKVRTDLKKEVRERFDYLYNACGGEEAEGHADWIPGILKSVEDCKELDDDPEALAAFAYLTAVADTMNLGILGMLDRVLGEF